MNRHASSHRVPRNSTFRNAKQNDNLVLDVRHVKGHLATDA